MIFAYGWILLLAPLPLLTSRFAVHRESQASLRFPSLDRLSRITGNKPSTGAVILQRSRMQWLLLSMAWLLSLLAVARPQLVGDPITKTVASRDLLLAVDLSGSMDTEDFTDRNGNRVDRLTAVKEVLDDFLSRRQGDRVGLIFFGSAAFVQAPFTEDLELCRTLLDEAQVRMAGPQTVIGDAVGLALTVFERSEMKDRVLIVLTDGNDTNSKVPPDRAAEIARDAGVMIHTIAVGDPGAVGEEKIDEATLQAMAKTTGGSFFRAEDRDELEKIYEQLDQLDTRELEQQSYRPKTELFLYPLAAMLLIGLAYHGTCAWKVQRRSNHSSSLARAAAMGLVCLSLGAVESTSVASSIAKFHFLRPAWLLALIPIALIVWQIRRRQSGQAAWQDVIDPHLLEHLLVRPDSQRRFRPVHLLTITWLLSTLALAGPTWRREPSPFTDDEAALVITMAVTPTMEAQDIQPSRLERSVQKIRDLLTLREGMNTALVAYAGSAHLVMPITQDAEIIETFAGELKPDIMPKQGDAVAEAIVLAEQILEGAGRPGSILLITDHLDLSAVDSSSLSHGSPVHILAVAGDQSKPLPLGSPPAPLSIVKHSARVPQV